MTRPISSMDAQRADEVRAYNRAHYAANREKRKATVKAWQQTNAEQVSAANKARYAANREERRAKANAQIAANPTLNRERSIAWQKANPEKAAARKQAWVEANREKTRASTKTWASANPGARNAMGATRRARLARATPPWANHDEIREVYNLAAWLGMHVDHIHPINGANFCGLHVPWNLQVLTPIENLRKGNKLLPEFAS